MTSNKDNIEIFRGDLVAVKEVDGVTFRLFSNRIYYVFVPQFNKVSVDIVNAGYSFLEENGGGKFYNIFHFDSYSDVDPEVREWAASPSNNNYTHIDAIVIGSLSQKIITDFYLKFNKPVKPTRIFYSLEKAVSWTLEQMNDE